MPPYFVSIYTSPFYAKSKVYAIAYAPKWKDGDSNLSMEQVIQKRYSNKNQIRMLKMYLYPLVIETTNEISWVHMSIQHISDLLDAIDNEDISNLDYSYPASTTHLDFSPVLRNLIIMKGDVIDELLKLEGGKKREKKEVVEVSQEIINGLKLGDNLLKYAIPEKIEDFIDDFDESDIEEEIE